MHTLAWTHFGPPRTTSIAVPPLPTLIDWYVLDYDRARDEVVYLCKPDDDERGLELHAFDGAAWNKRTPKRVPFAGSHVEGGGYDDARRAVVAWSFDHDYETKRIRPHGVAIADGKGVDVATRGDEPIVEAEGDDNIGTFDKHGLFAFDHARLVWVCLTRCGVWELAADGTWSTKSTDHALIPKEWSNKSGEGTYDPVGRRAVFLVQDGDDEIVVLAWDGAKLTRLPMKGLPELTFGFNDPNAQVAGHATHGLVLHAGAGRLFKATPAGWSALPKTTEPPPNMEAACLTHDAKRDLLILGPGKHEGAGGSNRHSAFFALRGAAWERQGVVIAHSPIKDASYGNARFAHVGGVWYATGTHSLRTWRWDGGAWKEIVDKKEGEKVGGWEILQLVGADRLYAVMASGAVFALEGERWKQLAKKDPAFKVRQDFALAVDPSGRLVVWGGEAKGRKLNDTLFFEGKKWRVAKKASPQPADFKHGNKDSTWVGTTMIFDTALGALVRFGWEAVFVLQEDETWKPYTPKGYKASVSERAWGHVPVHDPATGETLLVDFAGDERKLWRDAQSRLVRFDLKACDVLGTIELPKELARKRQHDAAPYHALCQSFSYDPTAQSLYAQVLEDTTGTYELAFRDAFTRAKALGPHTLPGRATSTKAAPAAPSFTPVTLYRVGKTREWVTIEAGAKQVKATTGTIGAKKGTTKSTASKDPAKDAQALVAAKRKAGFALPKELAREALASLVGIESRALDVGKPMRSGAAPKSRVGGDPSGVTAATWPKIRRTPMGFLFQVETGDLLKKHAGVAVFCALDGEAANEPEENAVVLLRAADFKKSCPAPKDTPALPVRPIEIEAPKLEIDEDRASALAERDAELGAAIEKLGASKGMQADNLCDKLGGVPQFLQQDVPVKKHVFVAQLDFDGISTSKQWPDAGLMGCVYVFVAEDESSAFAFWQYT